MSRTSAPFDVYLRDPGPPSSSLPRPADDRISTRTVSAFQPSIKHMDPGSYSYPYSSPYSTHTSSHNGLSSAVADYIRSRNSSGSSSSRSTVSSHTALPPLDVRSAFCSSNDNSTRNAGGSNEALQFQMPAFLGDVSAVAPGGGGEVINPSGLPMFPSFSVSGNGMALPISQYAAWAPNSAHTFDPTDKAWLDKQTRQYALDEVSQSPLTPSVAPQSRKPSMPFDFSDSGPPSSSTTASASGFSQHEFEALSSSHLRFGLSNEPRSTAHGNRPSTAQSATLVPSLSTTTTAQASRVQENSLNAMPLPDTSLVPMSTEIYNTQAILSHSNSNNLPLYSLSGFHVLPVLSRVCTRPKPEITLGPVDTSCAFVIADARQPDTPIMYASRTFCELTGYAENEVIGRNCRFLQAPDGRVNCGDERKYTSLEAVRAMRRAVGPDAGPRSWRECQVSLVNYRKDGQPFVNRVSIIPVPAEDSPPVPANADNPTGWRTEIAFLVGFQVDLGEQPSRIVERLREGRYYPQYASMAEGAGKILNPSERSVKHMRNELRDWICDNKVQSALNLTTSCNAGSSTKVSPGADSSHQGTSAPAGAQSQLPDPLDTRQWLHLLLLEQIPDFILVLSLKGHFLYVAPAIRQVLGYESSELLGRCVADYCHPSDAVPLLRELKESTIAPVPSSSGHGFGLGIYGITDINSGQLASLDGAQVGGLTLEPATNFDLELNGGRARTVDLLFRMQHNNGNYVWIECLGRLHIEPGKGRKAIVLSGRICSLPHLDWNAVASSGGLVAPTNFVHQDSVEVTKTKKRKLTEEFDGENEQESEGDNVEIVREEREFWTILCEDGLILVAGTGIKDVLGWAAEEVIGRSVRDLFADVASSGSPLSGNSYYDLLEAIKRISNLPPSATEDGRLMGLECLLRRCDGKTRKVDVVLFGPSVMDSEIKLGMQRVVAQFKMRPAIQQTNSPDSQMIIPRSSSLQSASDMDVFAELAPDRASSWQYELQQLKFENRKMRQEVATLQSKLQTPSTSSTSSSSLVLNLDGSSSAHVGSNSR